MDFAWLPWVALVVVMCAVTIAIGVCVDVCIQRRRRRKLMLDEKPITFTQLAIDDILFSEEDSESDGDNMPDSKENTIPNNNKDSETPPMDDTHNMFV